jgi:hypothetical protein
MCHRYPGVFKLPVFVVAGLSAYVLLGCGEYKSNSFANYAEANESGIFERGWIPTFIPKSAYDIKEQHRMDVENIDVEFMFDPGDIGAFDSACALLEENTYLCDNSGYPVKIVVTRGNHAAIKSVQNGT